MKSFTKHLPLAVMGLVAAAALFHGPVAQLPDYHHFADQTHTLGIPHAADVLSNIGFALVAFWGWWRLGGVHAADRLGRAWPGYRLFLLGLLLTAFGSAWYHLDPNDASLIWDRLPIALAYAGLLAGAWSDTHGRNSAGLSGYLAAFAVFSVVWWQGTGAGWIAGTAGVGDLRPYLLLQGAPFMLIPLWQWLHGSPRAERRAFGLALLLYALAKIAELHDHEIAHVLGWLTGHTLKHLLATAAVSVIVLRLVRRSSPACEVAAQAVPVISCVHR